MYTMSKSVLVLAIALAFAWAGGAVGQPYLTSEENELDYYDAFRDQSGAIPNFPFRICNTSAGAYRLAPLYRFIGSRTYCFTIQVADPPACSGSCCNTDLHKLEFNVSSSCLVAGASVNASINGVRTRVGPALDVPPYSNPGAGVLRITQLLLNTTTARNAELCITLNTNRGGRGCTTLEQLCAGPDGTAPGTCFASIFDVACDCCPISSAIEARPPPPPPPSPPPLVPMIVTPTCDLRAPVCISATLQPPPYDPTPYRYNASTCASIQSTIANSIAAAAPPASAGSVVFLPEPARCSDTVISVCGNFTTYEVAKNFTGTVISPLVSSWVEVAAGGDICRPEFQGYEVTLAVADKDRRIKLFESASCSLPSTADCSCPPGPGGP